MVVDININDLIVNDNTPAFYKEYGQPCDLNSIFPGSGGMTSDYDIRPSGVYYSLTLINENTNLLLSQIQQICEIFSLNEVEFSKVCKVSRKTVYNWKDGSPKTRARNSNRLFELYTASKNWNALGYRLNRSSLVQKVLNGKSVFDILQEIPLNKEQLLFAGQTLTMTTRNKKPLGNPFT